MTYLLPCNVLNGVVCIIRRQSPNFFVRRKSLRELDQAIYALLTAVGANVEDSEYSRTYREAVSAMPSDFEMAEKFRKIAIADNPLAPDVCSPHVLGHLETRARKRWTNPTGRPMRNRPYHLIQIGWPDLDEWEQRDLRRMARELESEYRSKIRRGAPGKSTQNALLIGLADIFLRATNDWTTDPLEIPHSIRSFFIQFAHAAASPFFPKTEVSRKALSDRWASWKRSQNRPGGNFRPKKRQIRKRPNGLK